MKTVQFFMTYLSLSMFVFAGDLPSIIGLSKGQKMTVVYSTTGCFHSSEYLFEFSRNSVRVRDLYSGMDDTKQIQLSEKDIIGLDKLFEFYASEKSQGCTSVDTIHIKLLNGSEVIKEYNYVDGSCSVYEQKGVVTFNTLLEYFKK